MYWDAPVSMLLYPGHEFHQNIEGHYHQGKPNDQSMNKCILSFISLLDVNNKLDRNVGQKIRGLVSNSVLSSEAP